MRISRKIRQFPATSLRRGLTLMEVMASTAVLALLLSITVQITTQTDTAIRASERHMKVAVEARTALDRFEADFSTAMLTAGATALHYNNIASTPNSAIRFISLSRARTTAETLQPRGAIIGYGINGPEMGLGALDLPEGAFVRGDGRARFSGQNSSFADVFANLSDMPPPAMNWESLGDGLLRFHISYVLDNGDIVQTPPEYSMISAQTEQPVSFLNGLNTAGWTAVAFAKENAPASGRYVVALKVAIAGASPDVIEQARKANKLDSVLTALGTPGLGETALKVWESNLTNIDFPPLRQSIRFYQRTVPIP